MTGLRVRDVARIGTEISPPSPEAQRSLAALLDSPSLRNVLDETGRRELESLRSESDPQLLAEGLLNLGIRLEQADRVEAAAAIFSELAERNLGPESQRARQGLDAILGRGALGARSEFLLRRLAREAADPAMLAGMAGAQAVFGLTRMALLSRLAASPTASFFTRGFGARALASAGAFAVEAPSFVGFTRGAQAALGRDQDWRLATLSREVASSYLTLGAMKLTSWGMQTLFPRSQGWSAAFYQQAGMLGGIALSHRLETSLGLRPQVDGATTLVDSLALLLQFHVGGRLMQGAFPEIEGFSRELAWRERILTEQPSKPRSDFGLFGPASDFAGVGISAPATERSPSPRFLDHVFMAAQVPGDPAGLRASGISGDRRSTLRPSPAVAQPRSSEGPPTRVSAFRFPEVPESCLCLVVEYFSNSPGQRLPKPLLRNIQEGLVTNPNLEEVRLRLPDGSVHFFHRGEDGGILENWEGREQAKALESWNLYPTERVTRLRLLAPWEPESVATSLPEFLLDLRRRFGLTQPQVAERIQSITGEAKDYNVIRRYESNSDAAIAFPILRALAEIYGVEIRTLIQLSNQSRFPEIPAAHWTTRDYPIYLENSADLRRIRYFAEQDPQRKGFGWLVYSSRKNPFHYHTTVDLGAGTDLNSNAFSRLELEMNPPSQRAVQGLARTLGIPEGELIRRSNRTFFPEFDIDRLFPGQEIFIDSLADDPRKIQTYAAEPGSLGQRLFAYRKTLPDRPGTIALSKRLGHHDNYWAERELNKIPIDRTNWRNWYDLLTRLGLATDPLRPFLGEKQAEEPKASVLFHEALQGEAVNHFAERTGFDRKGLGLLLGAKSRAVQPETILDLQRALPALEGALFYRALRPELKDFFPETTGPEPRLNISREEIAESMALNLGEDLYAYRMQHGIELAQLAASLGISDNTLKNYESISVQIENPEVLRRAARILDIDPRVLYIHYHPQILRLFPIQEGLLSDAEFRYWMKERASVRDAGNLREPLYATAFEAGIKNAEALEKHMAISPHLARKYWQKIHPLTVEEIQNLIQSFPALSYREWYEHFQGHALSYFLGRRMDGEIDYSLPEGWNADTLSSWDLRGEIRRAIAARYDSPEAAADAIGVRFLADRDNLNRSLKDRTWTNDTIASVARGLGIDRRALYLYFRGSELGPMLESRP